MKTLLSTPGSRQRKRH